MLNPLGNLGIGSHLFYSLLNLKLYLLLEDQVGVNCRDGKNGRGKGYICRLVLARASVGAGRISFFYRPTPRKGAKWV